KNRRPSRFDPKPKPIACGMEGAGSGERRVAKDREDFVEISQADAAPGRGANELKGVAENRPTQIAGDDADIARAEIKPLEGLSAEEEHDREEDKHHGNTECDPRGRAPAQGERREPERTAHHENDDAGPGKIEND